MAHINKRETGNSFEKLAGKYLEEKGLTIIEYNFYCKIGEIDIVARDGNYLVFVEVKYRRNNKLGSAVGAVTPANMRKICKTADYYMLTHRFKGDTPVRFDVVAIENGHLTHLKNAFDYIL